jgi:hypothetical protein
MRSRWLAYACATIVSLCCSPAPASAQDGSGCGRAGRPWIAVAFAGEAWTLDLQRAVLAELRAGLRLRGIEACGLGTEGSEPPLGLLSLQAAVPERVAVSIELHDALTEKRVLRDIDVRKVTSDARALAIAAAADELLRASWAELALVDAPAPARTPPPEVKRAVQRSLVPQRVGARDHALGVRAAAEYASGGETLLGGDLYLGLWPDARFGFELGLGLREGQTRKAQHGSVDARVLSVSAELAFALLPRDQPFGLALKLGLAVANVQMRGVASAGTALQAAGEGWDVHARTGLTAGLALLPWLAARADLGIGAALRSVKAADAGRVVASTAGVQLLGGLGLEARF